jgi:hypothetical protein
MFYAGRAMSPPGQCPRCDKLAEEIARIHHELASAGIAAAPRQTIDDNDLERELARFLTNVREPTPAAAYRAGWHALGRVSRPRLQEWQQLWRQASGETDRLRSAVGRLLMDIARLSDRG